MIKYQVRSRDLITVFNEISVGRLILDAYFQRNLVWREIHKQEFIKTILLGYPCPQIFISRGTIDVENMITTSCVVDGQQRLNAICNFIAGDFSVDGRSYQQLSGDEKSNFLKYELAVIELDLDNNDERVKDIFQRLNRTSNSLTAIEKLASQYAPSQYMLVASHLAGELDATNDDDGEATFRVDPSVDRTFFAWADANPTPNFRRLYQDYGVFKPYEISRKVHLMHILNMMTTMLGGFFNRNLKTKEYLDTYAQQFDDKDTVISLLEGSAEIIHLANLPLGSYWLNKANLFSLVIALSEPIRKNQTVNPERLKEELMTLGSNLPEEYRLAATEGVNDLQERRTRHTHLAGTVDRASI
jgi:hypothetical protein